MGIGDLLGIAPCYYHIGRYAATIGGRPCGVAGGVAPSLFAAMPGIGLFYLNLHARTVPTPLLIYVPAP